MSTQRAASLGRTAVVLRRRAVALALASFATVLGSWYLMVATRAGQLVEQAAITGSFIGARFVTSQARWLLSTVSMPAAVALVMVILVIGLWGSARRRAWWAAAVVVAVNVSTQVLKHWVLTRPDYGVSLRYDGANTLPSGQPGGALRRGQVPPWRRSWATPPSCASGTDRLTWWRPSPWQWAGRPSLWPVGPGTHLLTLIRPGSRVPVATAWLAARVTRVTCGCSCGAERCAACSAWR